MLEQENAVFQNVLEIIETLPDYRQTYIVEIIGKRLIECNREVLAKNIKKAREEYKKVEIRIGTVEDLMKEVGD